MWVCFRVGVEELEGKQMGSDGVRDRKGRRRGCTMTEVQSFLGFVNFYWKFICDFSNIACPLYALTHKTQQWVWGLAEQEAFDALKKAVTSVSILTIPSQSSVGGIMVPSINHLWSPVWKLSAALRVASYSNSFHHAKPV